VFQYTAPAAPSRHKDALAIFLGTDVHDPRVSRLADADVGPALFDAIAKFLDVLNVPRGLKAVGYGKSDVERLVEGTIPQRRVLDLAPGIGDVVGADGKEALTSIIENSLEY
jgi:hydroxyacid-oxoacid transhydrogenase